MRSKTIWLTFIQNHNRKVIKRFGYLRMKWIAWLLCLEDTQNNTVFPLIVYEKSGQALCLSAFLHDGWFPGEVKRRFQKAKDYENIKIMVASFGYPANCKKKGNLLYCFCGSVHTHF